MKVLDLCAGLGGFTEAFARSEEWEVMRIDNNPLLEEVEHMHIICIKSFRDELYSMIERGYRPQSPDLITFSPPCGDFSLGFNAPQAVASREGRFGSYEPDLSILEAGIEIIEMLKPRFSIIENVRGARRHFEPLLGEPKIVKDCYVFWGNFPFFDWQEKKDKTNLSNAKLGYHRDFRPQLRSLIPLEISGNLKKAIESQTTLFQF